LTTEYFCPQCGIQTTDNVNNEQSKKSHGYVLICGCGGECYIEIRKIRMTSDEEIEKAFQDTPLTDSQRGTKRHTSPIRKKA
jgi:transcription elongation factor Elf1